MLQSDDGNGGGDLTVGQMAARSGLAISALHYYEAEGLIHSSRTQAGHRRFDRRELRRIAIIRVAQSLGLSLADIRMMLDRVPQGKSVRRTDWQAASEIWRGVLNNKIERLLRLRDQLDSCIGCGCLSLEACPLSMETTGSPQVDLDLACGLQFKRSDPPITLVANIPIKARLVFPTFATSQNREFCGSRNVRIGAFRSIRKIPMILAGNKLYHYK